MYRVYHLTDEEKAKGVIASSAGNHAQGVALGAKMTGIKWARIWMNWIRRLTVCVKS